MTYFLEKILNSTKILFVKFINYYLKYLVFIEETPNYV